jgi:DNA mismatch endonuclease (patch repair protein)
MVPLTRSEQMQRIKGSNTEPELLLRRALWHRGLRYRVGGKTPAGRPDIVFASHKIAIFIDGCFWHGCPEHYVRPRSKVEFWAKKLEENTARDSRQVLELESKGWKVIRIWEHDVFEQLDAAADSIVAQLSDGEDIRSPSWRVWRVAALDETGTFERRHLRELRGLAAERYVDQARHTRKWKRKTTPPQRDAPDRDPQLEV